MRHNDLFKMTSPSYPCLNHLSFLRVKINIQSLTDETITINLTQNYNESDLATWPKVLNMSIIDHIIMSGPSQVHLSEFPKDEKGRHFSSTHYSRKLSNEETIRRRWLVYSVSNNSVFCFCCRLFDSKSASNLAAAEGFKKWRHLSDALKMHENSPCLLYTSRCV